VKVSRFPTSKRDKHTGRDLDVSDPKRPTTPGKCSYGSDDKTSDFQGGETMTGTDITRLNNKAADEGRRQEGTRTAGPV
jgi:hypothetical protein